MGFNMPFNPYIFRGVISDDLSQLGTPANRPDLKEQVLLDKSCEIVETTLTPEQREIISAIASGAKIHPANTQAAEALRDLAYYYVRRKGESAK